VFRVPGATIDLRTASSSVVRLFSSSSFGRGLEGRERLVPEPFEVLTQLGEPVAVNAVEVARALPAGSDESGVLEHAEVL
jgi:hypothetical protein